MIHSFILQIYTISNGGKDLQVLADKETVITKPTRVRVDKEGRRMAVINRNGTEIKVYKLIVVSFDIKLFFVFTFQIKVGQ